MSKLTAYYDWIKVVLDCLSGYKPSHVDPFSLRQGPVSLPLLSIEQRDAMLGFYRGRLFDTQNSNLAPKRRLHHNRACREAANAYKTLYRAEPCDAGVECFIAPLQHVKAALECNIKLRDYDERHPISQSELTLTVDDLQAQKAWLRFKLDSIRPCLLLLVQLFRLLLPDYNDFWEETEESLSAHDWHSHFIYDSKKSQRRTIPPFPKLSDVLRQMPPSQSSGGSDSTGTPV